MAQAKFELTLVAIRALTPTVNEFSFKTSHQLKFTAGQFISLHFLSGETEVKRNYSITNSPLEGEGIVVITVSYVPNGLASTVLWNLKMGDTVTASGPYGIFVLDFKPDHRYLLIGTGTGIAPYRSMLQDLKPLLLANPKTEVIVLQGVRKKEDLLYADDFNSMQDDHSNFKFFACYSKEMKISYDYECLGYVQHKLSLLNPIAGKDIPYLCGNPLMVDELFNLLQEQGFDRRAIKREKYISAK